MKVLVIIGDCVKTNSSANLCHLSYLRGLVELGNEVTLISADAHGYEIDEAMCIPDGVISYTYKSETLYEKLSTLKKRRKKNSQRKAPVSSGSKGNNSFSQKVKSIILSCYGPHGIYSKFAFTAFKFRSNETYDLLISLAAPASSHLLAQKLLASNHVKSKHWIQIWEDPWYADAYGNSRNNRIFQEEKRLLSFADRICYVSPITLMYQKKLFPESAEKMFWVPLPSYYETDGEVLHQPADNLYGYFGDYKKPARDLEPFYDAARATGIEVNICGTSNLTLDSTEKIHIFPRLSLTELRPIENRTGILVFLSNRTGGQIPGKIYQYAATYKTILFILDGSEDEKETLKDFFKPFNRFIFCDNNEEDIKRVIRMISSGNLNGVQNRPLTQFKAKEIVTKIINEGIK